MPVYKTHEGEDSSTSVLQVFPHPPGQLLNRQQGALEALSLLLPQPCLDWLEGLLAAGHIGCHHLPQLLRRLSSLCINPSSLKRLTNATRGWGCRTSLVLLDTAKCMLWQTLGLLESSRVNCASSLPCHITETSVRPQLCTGDFG